MTFTVPFEDPPAFAVRLQPAGKIRGRIDGLPLIDPREGGYNIFVVRTGGEKDQGTTGKAAAKGPAVVASIILGEQGTFAVDGLRPGTYRIDLERITLRQGGSPEMGPAPTSGQVRVRAVFKPGPGAPSGTVPSARPLGEVEVRAGETSEFRAQGK